VHREAGLRALVRDGAVGTFGLVDAQHVAIARQKIADGVAPGQIHPYVMHQRMCARAAYQRGERAAQRIRMAEAGAEFDELARKGGLHVPAPRGTCPAGHVAEVEQQAFARRLVGDKAADDLKAIPFKVFGAQPF